jgi:hypothetical protein
MKITPEMILDAYENTGLKPKQGDYFSKDGKCACGLGAFYAFNNNTKELDGSYVGNYISKLISYDYLSGFIDGFDSNEYIGDPLDEEIIGYKDGIAAWEAVKHLAE